MTRFTNVVLIAAVGLAFGCGGGKKSGGGNPKPPVGGEGGGEEKMEATDAVAKTEPTPPKEEPKPPEPPRKKMISLTPAELKWMPLDEKAGDKGPMFAQAWGEMGAANGMFIKLPAANKGLLHTHTGDYHAIGIVGNVTNAQDGTKKPAVHTNGSYWFQPGGAAHITACNKGSECMGYVYWPTKMDFAPATAAKGAKPDPKYVEKALKAAKWTPADPKNPKGVNFSSLWGDMASEPNGALVKIPAGSPDFYHIHTHDYHAVVLAGVVNNVESGSEPKDLPVGSYWMQPGGNKHTTNCKAGKDCLVYIHLMGKFDLTPAK